MPILDLCCLSPHSHRARASGLSVLMDPCSGCSAALLSSPARASNNSPAPAGIASLKLRAHRRRHKATPPAEPLMESELATPAQSSVMMVSGTGGERAWTMTTEEVARVLSEWALF